MNRAVCPQGIRLGIETIEMCNRLIGQHICLFARPLDAQQGDEGRLAGAGILAHRLAHRSRIAFGVKQIVGDLEGQTDIMGIGLKRLALRDAAPCRGSRRPRRKRRSAARSSSAADRVISGMSRSHVLGQQIEHLAGHHADSRRRRRPARPPARSAPAGRNGCRAWRQHFEGAGQQRVAGQDRGGLVVLLVQWSAGRGADRRRPSPADRHGPANSSAPSRSPPRRAGWKSVETLNRPAVSITRNGRRRLPPSSAA